MEYIAKSVVGGGMMGLVKIHFAVENGYFAAVDVGIAVYLASQYGPKSDFLKGVYAATSLVVVRQILPLIPLA